MTIESKVDENMMRKQSEGMTLEELEVKLEATRYLFFDAVVDGAEPNLTRGLLEAYRVRSDIYYERKYQK